MHEHDSERVEAARHIVAQGDEAGFPAERIAEAKRVVVEAELQRIEDYFRTTQLAGIGDDDDQDSWGDLIVEMSLLLGIDGPGGDSVSDSPQAEREAEWERFEDAIAAHESTTIRGLYEELLSKFACPTCGAPLGADGICSEHPMRKESN